MVLSNIFYGEPEARITQFRESVVSALEKRSLNTLENSMVVFDRVVVDFGVDSDHYNGILLEDEV